MNSLKQNDTLLKELRQEIKILNELNLSIGHGGSEHCAMAALRIVPWLLEVKTAQMNYKAGDLDWTNFQVLNLSVHHNLLSSFFLLQGKAEMPSMVEFNGRRCPMMAFSSK